MGLWTDCVPFGGAQLRRFAVFPQGNAAAPPPHIKKIVAVPSISVNRPPVPRYCPAPGITRVGDESRRHMTSLGLGEPRMCQDQGQGRETNPIQRTK